MTKKDKSDYELELTGQMDLLDNFECTLDEIDLTMGLVVYCKTEEDVEKLFAELTDRGFVCDRLLT